MGGDHDHGPGLARAGERHRGRLLLAFAIIFTFFIVEAVAGVITNSLALLAHAGHMLTDVIGIGMALAAIQLASHFERDLREMVGRIGRIVVAGAGSASGSYPTGNTGRSRISAFEPMPIRPHLAALHANDPSAPHPEHGDATS